MRNRHVQSSQMDMSAAGWSCQSHVGSCGQEPESSLRSAVLDRRFAREPGFLEAMKIVLKFLIFTQTPVELGPTMKMEQTWEKILKGEDSQVSLR